MGLVELYAICSSILVIVVYTVIIRDRIQEYKYRKDMKRKAEQAYKLLTEAQLLTREVLDNG